MENVVSLSGAKNPAINFGWMYLSQKIITASNGKVPEDLFVKNKKNKKKK